MVAPLHASWFAAVSANARFCVKDAVPCAAIVAFIVFAGKLKSPTRQPGADVVIVVETVPTCTLYEFGLLTVTVTGVLDPGVMPLTAELEIVRLSFVVPAAAEPDPDPPVVQYA